MIKKYENFIGDKKNPIYKESETGKEHSLKYDEIDIEFAKYLRQNYYSVKLSNYDVYELKKKFNYEN